MANSNTLNYNLVKPQVGAATDNWGSLLNNNFDVIDSQLKDNETAVGTVAAAANTKLPIGGGTMNGPLILSETGSDLSPDNQAAAIKYVKDKVASAQIAAGQGLPLTGGDMKGFITLHANPTSNMHATTKQYADAIVKSSFVMNSGTNITLGGPPTDNLHAATKAYVDGKSTAGALILTSGTSQTITGQVLSSYPVSSGSPDAQLATVGFVKNNTSAGAAILSTSSTQTFSGSIVMSSNLSVNGTLSGGTINCSTLTATSDITLSSDVRIKEDIRQITDALDLVNQLRGVSYVRKDTKKPSIGVVAQEIEQVLPSVVYTDDAGMKSVAYANMVGVLIEAVKELTTRVKELEAR